MSEKIDAKKLAALMHRYLSNQNYSGRKGSALEVMLRAFLTGKVAAMSRAGLCDIAFKRGVTIEAKTGAGYLVNPVFDSKEDAMAFFTEAYAPMTKAMFIAYCPKFTGTLDDVRILTQKTFLGILSQYNLIRTRKSRGLWGIAIQNWIPTKNFKPSLKKVEAVKAALDSGMTVAEFKARYK